MVEELVSDELWERIAPVLPPVPSRRFRHPGRRRVDDRVALAGSVFVLKTGIGWPGLARPDIQLLFMDVPFHPPVLAGPQLGYTIAFAGLRPLSRGRVSLASADPAAAPLIDPGFIARRVISTR